MVRHTKYCLETLHLKTWLSQHSKCCLKTADLSQHSSDCLQDTSVPRHARLSRDISGSARAMACVETGRLITAPCVARRDVRNRRRTEIQLNNNRASTVQSVPPREDGCSTNRRRWCTRREDIKSNCLLRRASARARQRLRRSYPSACILCGARVCARCCPAARGRYDGTTMRLATPLLLPFF